MPYTRVLNENTTASAATASSSGVDSIQNAVYTAFDTTSRYLIERYDLWLQFACSSPERKLIAFSILSMAGLCMVMLIKRIHAL